MEIGDQKIIVLEKNLFKNDGELHYAFVTIVNKRDNVPGDYNPSELHTGYKAQSADGHIYLCQWDSYDDSSMSPYSNWRREAIEGRDYIKDGPWIGDDIELFFGWDLVSILNHPTMPNDQRYLCPPFSDMIGYCNKVHTMNNGKPNTDSGDKHNLWFYVSDGCIFCRHGV